MSTRLKMFVLSVMFALFFALPGHAQTAASFSGNGGRCNVNLTSDRSKSTSYLCGNVPVYLNGESVPTHHIGFSVIVTDGVFDNGSFALFNANGSIVFVSSNWMGTITADGSLNGSFSGVLPDGVNFTGSATQTIGRQKVQTYRLVSYIWLVKTGNGVFSTSN